MPSLEAGHVVAGKYRLARRLGEGGMGSVWSAEHLELKSQVAVKLIVARYARNQHILTRFTREAQAAAALRSPHVVQILDHGVDAGVPYIVMEQLEGENLAERLRREPRLGPRFTATIVTHVARAVARAHEADFIHRDLKPDNVFLVQNDDEIIAKVLDFGIAKALAPEEALNVWTETGAVLGSPFYMSPEQARGRRDIDARSDLWTLGVLAFECLVGRRPFEGTSLGEVVSMICIEPLPVPSALAPVPPGFDAWFSRATQRDASKRFQSAKELAVSLRQVLVPEQG
jgi:serine/threonine-protein kinase